MELNKLPSEVHINASLLALIKCDLVGVGELKDGLIGGPVLDSSILSASSLELVLSEELLIIEWVEVGSLSLVGELWRVAQEVSVEVVPSVIKVSVHSELVVDFVNEDVVLSLVLFKIAEAFDELALVVESSSNNESLVGELLSI